MGKKIVLPVTFLIQYGTFGPVCLAPYPFISSDLLFNDK